MDKNIRSAEPSLLTQLRSLGHSTTHNEKEDVLLAAAVALLEVASCDHTLDKFERAIIHAGLRSLFQVSDEVATSVILQAKNHLNNLRGSSAEVQVLKESLDPVSRKAVAKILDDLVNSHGGAQGFEIYLRNRLRGALGLPVEEVTKSA